MSLCHQRHFMAGVGCPNVMVVDRDSYQYPPTRNGCSAGLWYINAWPGASIHSGPSFPLKHSLRSFMRLALAPLGWQERCRPLIRVGSSSTDGARAKRLAHLEYFLSFVDHSHKKLPLGKGAAVVGHE